MAAPEFSVPLQDLLKLRTSLSREAFLLQHPSPVLLIPRASNLENDPFRTQVLPVDAPDAPSPVAQFSVAPVQKRRGAPQQSFVWVGREPGCDVVLAYEGVSKLQAHFSRRPDGELELLDANSTNGTFVNDKRLAANEPAVMKDQTRLRFGPVSVRFRTAAGLWDELGKLGR